MSFFDIDTVRGNHIAQAPKAGQVSFDPALLSGRDLMTAKAVKINGRDYVIASEQADQKARFDLTKQVWLPAPDASEIREIAQSYYLPENGEIARAALLTEAPIEYRKALPVWQVEFADKPKTRLYLHPQTGELLNVRTRLWRAFDFMWMLHIMDYKSRDNINHWWLWLVALMASLFALSGLALVVHRIVLRPRRAR
jgi:hypothetical protein